MAPSMVQWISSGKGWTYLVLENLLQSFVQNASHVSFANVINLRGMQVEEKAYKTY